MGNAGLFDVSHMVPLRFFGKDRARFMETFLVGDIQELPENMGTLSSIPNAQGGLIDDCICTNAGDHIYLVINAGHEDKDIPHIQALLDAFDADVILGQIADKSLVKRKRVGFVTQGAPAREGMHILNEEGDKIGVVTSGVSSPCLKKPLGMAYVEKKYFKSGTKLQVQVRKKVQPLTVTKMPFVPTNFYRGA